MTNLDSLAGNLDSLPVDVYFVGDARESRNIDSATDPDQRGSLYWRTGPVLHAATLTESVWT